MQFEICLDHDFQSDELKAATLECFKFKFQKNNLGRGGITFKHIGEETFVLRRYLRGGMLTGTDIHLTGLKERAKSEFELTSVLYNAGYPTIEPVGYAIAKSRLFSRGIFISKFIEDTRTLDQITDRKLAYTLSYEVGKSCGEIIEFGITHTDLHPRNVIVVGEEFKILDFDRAKNTTNIEISARRIFKRWERFIRKYDLNKEFLEGFRRGVARWVK